MQTSHRLLFVAMAAMAMMATTAGLGCGSKQAEAPHGSPVLLEVFWEVDGFSHRVWSRDPDAALPPTAAAPATKIDFVFDRKLDGARIEDTVGGSPAPKATPPITVSWPDMATTMSDPPFAADVYYNSLPDFGAGTTYVFVRPHVAGFPSATPITFSLDANGLTSVYGEPMDGPAAITVTTSPLTVTLPNTTATVPTSYQAAVVFSTRAPSEAALMPFLHVAASGISLPFTVVDDLSDAKRLYVIPTCTDGWPANARVEITADKGLPDGFGRPLDAAVKGSFMTSRIAAMPVDGGCGPLEAGVPSDAAPSSSDTAPSSSDTAPSSSDTAPSSSDTAAPDGGAPDADAPDVAPDAA